MKKNKADNVLWEALWDASSVKERSDHIISVRAGIDTNEAIDEISVMIHPQAPPPKSKPAPKPNRKAVAP